MIHQLALKTPVLSLDERIAERKRHLKSLAMTDPERARIAMQIVNLEDEQDAQHAARAELAR